MKNENKLKGKDLINIGIYAAIYCVVMMCLAMLGFIPIFMPLLSVLGPIIGGIPMMLFYTKTKKFGMISIFSVILGGFFWLTGMGIYPFIAGVVFGVVADYVAKSGNYQSKSKTIISYGILCMTIAANYLPMYLAPAAYVAARPTFGQEYFDELFKLMPTWSCPVMFIVALVCGCIGAWVGMKLLKKHFVKAGIA